MHVSPQYHVIFDDSFATVSSGVPTLPDADYQRLYSTDDWVFKNSFSFDADQHLFDSFWEAPPANHLKVHPAPPTHKTRTPRPSSPCSPKSGAFEGRNPQGCPPSTHPPLPYARSQGEHPREIPPQSPSAGEPPDYPTGDHAEPPPTGEHAVSYDAGEQARFPSGDHLPPATRPRIPLANMSRHPQKANRPYPQSVTTLGPTHPPSYQLG
jgi:hypothetical protein